MADEDTKRAAHRVLVERILTGEGHTSADQRRRAFDHVDVPPPLQPLLCHVVTAPTQVSDGDFATAAAAGYTEEQLVELVISAALGASSRMYDAGLAALDEATGEGPDDAT